MFGSLREEQYLQTHNQFCYFIKTLRLFSAREKKPILIQPLTSVKTKLGEPEAVMQCKIGNASTPPGCNINLYKDDQLVPVNNTRVKVISSLRVLIGRELFEKFCVDGSKSSSSRR